MSEHRPTPFNTFPEMQQTIGQMALILIDRSEWETIGDIFTREYEMYRVFEGAHSMLPPDIRAADYMRAAGEAEALAAQHDKLKGLEFYDETYF